MDYNLMVNLVRFQENRVRFRQQQGQLNDMDKGILTVLKQKEYELRPRPVNIPFSEFWKQYDKKIMLPKAQKLWELMKDEEREAAIKHVIEYVKATPDKKFRKNPDTYLRNKCWNDEIVGEVVKNITNKEQKWL